MSVYVCVYYIYQVYKFFTHDRWHNTLPITDVLGVLGERSKKPRGALGCVVRYGPSAIAISVCFFSAWRELVVPQDGWSMMDSELLFLFHFITFMFKKKLQKNLSKIFSLPFFPIRKCYPSKIYNPKWESWRPSATLWIPSCVHGSSVVHEVSWYLVSNISWRQEQPNILGMVHSGTQLQIIHTVYMQCR